MRAVVLSCLAIAFSSVAADNSSIKPLGPDGQPLNLDFESGTLKDWTATGDAFTKQPLKGDLVSRRRTDMKSEHQGQYWIAGFEVNGDPGTGTLTSASFKVTQPWASFLVGGGPNESTRVEIVAKEDGKENVILKVAGSERENLQRAIIDLRKYQGKEMFVRLVDQHTGHWGHLNFDDFAFHAAKPNFAGAIDTTKKASLVALPPTDEVKFAGLSAVQAAKEITLPSGFKATLFAGEPDIQQPIAFCIDDRGRLWVAEGYTYPKRKGTPPVMDVGGTNSGQPTKEQLADIFGSNDRILVFEDTDNDGRFDKRHVFMEKLNLISGMEVGFCGVWIGAAPYLMFVPVKDWDSPKPAGDPQILLDGWDYTRDTHETLNTFQWGPDGWLYGCHGVFCPSNVGKPGTPKSQRQWVDAAVWRYHPTKHQFEVFAEGTSNPWGLDFDENGQAFIEACVIPHLFHMIQGARYQRQGGSHYAANADETQRFASKKEGKSDKTLNPYVYDDIKTIADHRHYVGDKGPHAANGRSDAAGGGHAHAGLLIYNGESFPAEYRGKLFMNNIHGQRINMDIPERQGSGFVGKHGTDFINFNDKWSQVIDLRSGPDGSVFLIDWYDKNQCHLNTIDSHDRSNGRIFKVSYGETKPVKVDLQKLSDEELVKLLASKNSWHARHAQRILQERLSSIPSSVYDINQHGPGFQKRTSVIGSLVKGMEGSTSSSERLRLLWTLHTTGNAWSKARDSFDHPMSFDPSVDPGVQLEKKLSSPDEQVRAWTIQLICEDKNPSDSLLKEFARMAREDKSPLVRLYLASALQRLPMEKRGDILEGLLAHAEDATDHNLPLMYWYAAEPLAGKDIATTAKLLAKTKIPQVREFITRRMTAGAK